MLILSSSKIILVYCDAESDLADEKLFEITDTASHPPNSDVNLPAEEETSGDAEDVPEARSLGSNGPQRKLPEFVLSSSTSSSTDDDGTATSNSTSATTSSNTTSSNATTLSSSPEVQLLSSTPNDEVIGEDVTNSSTVFYTDEKLHKFMAFTATTQVTILCLLLMFVALIFVFILVLMCRRRKKSMSTASSVGGVVLNSMTPRRGALDVPSIRRRDGDMEESIPLTPGNPFSAIF